MATPVWNQLIAFIEEQFEEYGFITSTGVRCVVIPHSLSTIAKQFNVSQGTVKNTLSGLEKAGYILFREGMYLRLSEGVLSTGNRPSGGEEREAKGEGRRRGEEEVRRILRELVRDSGPEVAMSYLRSHRVWCNLNHLDPWL